MEIKGKVIAAIGANLNFNRNLNKEIYIFDKIPKFTRKEKILEALKMVNLTEDYTLKKSNDLSNVEYNKLLLARDLILGSEIIFLDYFEKGMCFKEREYFKKLIKKLSRDYKLTFLINTNDFTFCINLVDEYHVFVNDVLSKIVSYKDSYKESIYKYYNNHQIIDFVLKSRKYNHLKNDYYEINEVLKAIYRELK